MREVRFQWLEHMQRTDAGDFGKKKKKNMLRMEPSFGRGGRAKWGYMDVIRVEMQQRKRESGRG